MIKQWLYPRTIDELKAIINKHAQGAKSIACQAGHFLVYYDNTEDFLLPGIAEELDGPRHEMIKQEVGYFPILTWELGLDILTNSNSAQKFILVVVNDWQYLPKKVDRLRFYSSHNDLVPSYKQRLSKATDVHLLEPASLKLGTKTSPYFSEASLRNQYSRHISKLVNSGKLGNNLKFINDVNGLECSLVDTIGRKQEVYCAGKQANCTQEIAELNRQVIIEARNDIFVNFFPLVCKEYVTGGTELAFSLFNITGCTVINVGMRSSGVNNVDDLLNSCECAVHYSEE